MIPVYHGRSPGSLFTAGGAQVPWQNSIRKEFMKTLLKDFRNRIIPLLFSISITWWVLESFSGELSPLDLFLVFVLHSLVFTGMTQAGKSNWRLFLFVVGTLLYFAAIIAVILSARENYTTRYLVWLATLEPGSRSIAPYQTATAFLVSYMFSAIVFYFSCIRDRIGILFMTGCIPLILHTAKSNKGMTLPFIFFVFLFFCLYIGKNRFLTMNQSESYSKRWYLAAVACFVIFVLGLSLLLPKLPVSPKLAEFDSVVFQAIRPLINAGNSDEGTGFESYYVQAASDRMELDKAGFPTSDRVLFLVDADEPLYLREQSRDTYIKNQWITNADELKEGYPVDQLYRRHLKVTALTEMLSVMEKADLVKLGFNTPEDIQKHPSLPQEHSEAVIRMNRVQTRFFLTTPGIYGLVTETGMEAQINELNYCYPSIMGMPGVFEKYRLKYLSQNVLPVSKEMAVIRQMNADVYRAFSKSRQVLYEKYEDALKASSLTESELMAVFFEADQEFKIAGDHFTSLPVDLPDKVVQLAASITSGMTTDYNKAIALENYFHTSGFRYDLTPPRLPYGKDINEYFLFDSKRGFCVHFASAMVILARACGLPARFTEGYICDEWNEQAGQYLVRVNDAHAFPEIYIAGIGWMVFEPTVSADNGNAFLPFINRTAQQIRVITQSITRLFQTLPTPVKLIFIPFILLGGFYLLWLYTRLRYRTWLKRTMKADGNQALKRIFIRLMALLKNVRIEMKKSETPSGYASRVFREKGIDIRALAEAYNKARYGGYRVSPEELQDFLMLYQEAASGVKTLVRGPKAWLIR